MADNVPVLSTKRWKADILGVSTEIAVSVSSSKQIAIVAVCQQPGIGSIFDASEEGVKCLLGARGEGLEEACALSLLRYLGCKRILLTCAMKDVTQESVRALLVDVSLQF